MKPKVLLAIDIGNTNISCGVFKRNALLKRFSLPTAKICCQAYWRQVLKKNKISAVAVCSVVPEATRRLKKVFSSYPGLSTYIIGKDILVPIKNLYRKPKQVGQDRLVNAYAGSKLYPTPLIIVDFGTATTFDIVSAKKEYLGGLIMPGINLALTALAKGTALLPQVKLAKPRFIIAKETRESMLSGVIYGLALAVEALTSKIRKHISRNAGLVVTGGNSGFISSYIKSMHTTNPELTLRGINFLLEQTMERRR